MPMTDWWDVVHLFPFWLEHSVVPTMPHLAGMRRLAAIPCMHANDRPSLWTFKKFVLALAPRRLLRRSRLSAPGRGAGLAAACGV